MDAEGNIFELVAQYRIDCFEERAVAAEEVEECEQRGYGVLLGLSVDRRRSGVDNSSGLDSRGVELRR